MVTAAMVITPWTMRNYLQFNRLVVFHSSSANPLLVATYWPNVAPDHAAVWPNSSSLNEFQLNAAWETEAEERIRAQLRTNPVGLVSHRLAGLWEAVSWPHGLLFLDDSMTAAEIWFNRSMRVLHLLILAGGVFALFTLWRDPGVTMIILVLASSLAMYAFVLPMARYAYPYMVLLCSLAGCTWAMMRDKVTITAPTRRNRAPI